MMIRMLFLISFNNSNTHFYVINGSVTTTSSSTLYHFHNVETIFDFTKYSVLTVKMRCTANSRVYLQLVIG